MRITNLNQIRIKAKRKKKLYNDKIPHLDKYFNSQNNRIKSRNIHFN